VSAPSPLPPPVAPAENVGTPSTDTES
jgi:hypothetical protein